MKILVVDDNKDIALILAKMLRYEGHQVRTADNGMRGLMLCLTFKPDIVVTDLEMPHMNGFELISAIRAKDPEIKAIYMSAEPDRFLSKLKAETASDGSDWLCKPFRLEQLLGAISGVTQLAMPVS
jgi:two-component system OmpR family response regulator